MTENKNVSFKLYFSTLELVPDKPGFKSTLYTSLFYVLDWIEAKLIFLFFLFFFFQMERSKWYLSIPQKQTFLKQKNLKVPVIELNRELTECTQQE